MGSEWGESTRSRTQPSQSQTVLSSQVRVRNKTQTLGLYYKRRETRIEMPQNKANRHRWRDRRRLYTTKQPRMLCIVLGVFSSRLLLLSSSSSSSLSFFFSSSPPVLAPPATKWNRSVLVQPTQLHDANGSKPNHIRCSRRDRRE